MRLSYMYTYLYLFNNLVKILEQFNRTSLTQQGQK